MEVCCGHGVSAIVVVKLRELVIIWCIVLLIGVCITVLSGVPQCQLASVSCSNRRIRGVGSYCAL